MTIWEKVTVGLDVSLQEPEGAPRKFADPDWTATREPRATVALERLETLWINTGTLCNITCQNCYIESSPSNDRLVYITAAEAAAYFDEIEAGGLGTREIGYTGGEPFMNPHLIAMVGDALNRGFEVLLLTNAMQPMQRPKVKRGLLELNARFGAHLTLRVSLDHYGRALHEAERGARTWARTIAGIDWLSQNGFRIAIAGKLGEARQIGEQAGDRTQFAFRRVRLRHRRQRRPAISAKARARRILRAAGATGKHQRCPARGAEALSELGGCAAG